MSTSPSSLLRERIWRSGWTFWLLLASLWGNALTLDASRSDAGAAARFAFCAPRAFVNPRTDILVAWREGKAPHGRIAVCRADRFYLRSKDDSILDAESMVFCPWPRPSRCLWAPFVDRTTTRISVIPTARTDPREASAIRAAAFDFLSAEPASVVAGLGSPLALRTSDITVWRVDPVGTAQNLLALASATALIAWIVQRARRGGVQTLGAMRQARGLCPACGYEMIGHDSPVCPECGGALPR